MIVIGMLQILQDVYMPLISVDHFIRTMALITQVMQLISDPSSYNFLALSIRSSVNIYPLRPLLNEPNESNHQKQAFIYNHIATE